MLKRPRRPPPCLCDDGVHHVPVDAGDRDEDADAVDREHHQGEDDAPPKLRDLVDVARSRARTAHRRWSLLRHARAAARRCLRRLREEDGLAAGLLDLRRAAFEKRVRVNGDFLVSSPLPSTLMRSKRPLTRPLSRSAALVDAGAGVEGLELAHVDLADDVAIGFMKPRFGRRRCKRRLAAFEVRLEVAARAGVLALLAATGGLAEAGARRRVRGAASSLRSRRRGLASLLRVSAMMLDPPRRVDQVQDLLDQRRGTTGVLLTTTALPGASEPEAREVEPHAMLTADGAR